MYAVERAKIEARKKGCPGCQERRPCRRNCRGVRGTASKLGERSLSVCQQSRHLHAQWRGTAQAGSSHPTSFGQLTVRSPAGIDATACRTRKKRRGHVSHMTSQTGGVWCPGESFQIITNPYNDGHASYRG
jgi:hypothetical protein